MKESLIDNLIQMRMVIVVSGVGILLLGLIGVLFSRNFSFKTKRLKFFACLYGLTTSQIMALSVSILKVLFVVSMFFTLVDIKAVHMAYFGILVLISCILRRDLKGIVFGIINGAVMMGILQVAGLLHGYLMDVYFDPKIAIILVVLMIFLGLYAMTDTYATLNLCIEDKIRWSRKANK